MPIVLTKNQLIKKRQGKCIMKWCGRVPPYQRNCCFRCTNRKYRAKNPMRYCYNNKKQNAKKKGHEFDLTFEEFKQFCDETKYLDKKGRTKRKFNIDRIDNTKGYTADNIQSITSQANRKKQNEENYPF